jgi:2-polyprenyl-3-methyl-5-hydroxy-6-metoxy-1,4-benzoquinol methylase
MFVEEALWIRRSIEEMSFLPGSRVADIGSSDFFYRTRAQPHVDEHIYEPLRRRGVEVVSCDSKKELGVDYVVDICSKQRTPFDDIHATFDLVLCANMLEHVVDRRLAVRNLLSLVQPGRYLLLTVPHTYFYHEDPIDTMFRPTPAELGALIAEQSVCEVVKEAILPITQKHYYLMPVYPAKFLHNIPFYAYRQAWRWLLRPFRWKVTCLLLRIVEVKDFSVLTQSMA